MADGQTQAPDPNIDKGDVSVKQQPGSGETELGGQLTLKFKGKDDASFDSTVDAAIPSTHYVVSRRKTPGKGGLAECVVVIRKKASGPSGGSGDNLLSCTFEVEMAQLEKPLLAHPDFSGYADVVGKWMNSPPEIKNANKYVSGVDANGAATVEDVTGEALTKVLPKIRKGVESYLVFAPVVTKTSVSGDRPDVGKDIGKRCAPDVEPDGDWDWLKTGDRAVQQQDGSWQRVEVWTGADEWDQDLYEAANAGGGS
jgi:hypothetical protein